MWGDEDLVEYFLDAALLSALQSFGDAGFALRLSEFDRGVFYQHYHALEADVYRRRESWVSAWNEYADLPF